MGCAGERPALAVSRALDDLGLWLTHQHGFAAEVPFKGLSGKRRFRFDFALDTSRGGVAVDYHGYGSGAAHKARNKQAGDHDKLNEAQLAGYTYIVCNAISVASGRCMEHIEMALQEVGHE